MEREFYDQFSDPSYRSLFNIVRQHPEAEELVKTANIDFEDNDKAPATTFAWPERRLFRIDTAAQAALSKLYITKQAGIPEDVKARCDRALDLFDVDVPLLEKTASAAEPSADEFLLPSVRRLRVQTKDDVKLASEAIRNNLRKMDTRTRAQACTNLVKKATDLDVSVPPWILKFAGFTMCDVDMLRRWVGARAEATKDAQIKYGFTKLSEELKRLPAYCGDRDELIKVASIIAELDAAAGLEGFYDRALPDPLSTVFNTEKLADEFVSLAGRQVPLQDMLAIEPEAYKDVFGEDLTDEFIDPATQEIMPDKLKVILPTVPLDLQKTLAAQIGV